jgi:hypothetical protein
MSLKDLAQHLGSSVPDVGYAVERGETIVPDNKYHPIDRLS